MTIFSKWTFLFAVLATGIVMAAWGSTALAQGGHVHGSHGGARGKDAKPADKPQAQVDVTVRSYLAVQQLLVQDKIDGVEAQFAKIRDAAKALTEHAKVKDQAQAIFKAIEVEPKTLKDARTAFKPLSSAVIALVQVIPASEQAAPVLFEASCPMAKANWLQADRELANPYMGKEMSDCGKIERKLGEGTPAHKH